MEKAKDITILNFIALCNEFIEGKYLFATTKLESIYKQILESPALVELFLQCSEDFKYSLEKTKAFVKTPTKLGTFTPPEDLDRFLALAFGLLKEIEEQSEEFNSFVPKYFSDEGKVPPTQRFANEFIKPLKNIVAKYFDLDPNNKTMLSLEDVQKQDTQSEKQVAPQTESQTPPESTQQNQQLPKPENKAENSQTQAQATAQAEEAQQESALLQQPVLTLDQLLNMCQTLFEVMLSTIKTTNRIKKTAKADAVFVLSRAIESCKTKDMEVFYSEIISLKYMKWHLRVVRFELKRVLELIEIFEAF